MICDHPEKARRRAFNLSSNLVFLIVTVFTVQTALAEDDEFDPGKLDLQKLIECRAQVPDYNQLTAWMQAEPDALKLLGWNRTDSGNPFLEQYRLDKPLNVFGSETKDIAFAGSGLLAVLDDGNAAALAKRLEIPAFIDSPVKFMGERVVAEDTDDSNEMITVKTRISLNVSTVESHPGKVLAGCSYSFSLDVKE